MLLAFAFYTFRTLGAKRQAAAKRRPGEGQLLSGFMRLQRSQYGAQYTIEVGQYIVIPESQDPIAIGAHRRVTISVERIA
jgi:hypothetical protein